MVHLCPPLTHGRCWFVRAVLGFALTVFLCRGGGNRLVAELRLPDDRPALDPERLAESGLNILASRRLILVTDIPVEEVRDLPPLADSLFDALERDLGPVPPDIAEKEFQVTGYLIGISERFRQASLLPPEEYPIRHGRHIGYQFWMNDQSSPYYRRHLLLHEFVHCFMMCIHGMRDIPPLWYTEGIAEYFATHAFSGSDGSAGFGILPPEVKGFEGWGRIQTIRQAAEFIRAPGWQLVGRPDRSSATKGVRETEPRSRRPVTRNSESGLSLDAVMYPDNTSFLRDIDYAQAWALVWLIRNHPELVPHFESFRTVRSLRQFRDAEQEVPEWVFQRMRILWPLYLDSLEEGFDGARSFPVLNPPLEFVAGDDRQARRIQVDSARGWQSAGMLFRAGRTLCMQATGRFAVHDDPRPWISEPQGITIDYYRGRPLGELHVMVISSAGDASPVKHIVGRETELLLESDSELWFQVNDSAASRQGNSGLLEITLTMKAPEL